MVSGSEAALGLAVALGASEASGVTDFTGLGGGGESDSSESQERGPAVDLSELRASVAGLRGAVGAASTFSRPTSGGGGGVDLSGLAALAANSGGSEPVTNIIGETARTGTNAVIDGARDGFTETTGIDRIQDMGTPNSRGSEPFADFEDTARTGGENIGSGLGGGLGNIIGVGVESAGNAVLRPYREQVSEIQTKLQEGPNLKDGSKLFPNDPLTNFARNNTPGENIDPVGALREFEANAPKSLAERANDLLNRDGPRDGSSADAPTNPTVSPRMSRSDSEANAGGDPASDPANSKGPDPKSDTMDEFRRELGGVR